MIGGVYGLEFEEAGLVTILVMPGVYAVVAFNLLSAEASGRGKPDLALRPFLIALLFNCLLNYIYVPEFGMEAAAIISSITYIFAVIYYIFAYKKN
jgi:O-antigen/teichoic acid export membrane protein